MSEASSAITNKDSAILIQGARQNNPKNLALAFPLTSFQAGGFDYVERFYNSRRRHSTLGPASSDQFEKAQKSLG